MKIFVMVIDEHVIIGEIDLMRGTGPRNPPEPANAATAASTDSAPALASSGIKSAQGLIQKIQFLTQAYVHA